MVRPTNPQAVGAPSTHGLPSVGRVGGDTETGVRKWIQRLSDKLKGESPAPVVIQPEAADGGDPTRIHLIVDYAAATV
jgi:hypothetical protein